MAGLIVCPFVFCRMVYPSGVDFATASAAIFPPAPGQRVDGAAGDEGNDDADRLARIVLGDGIARVKRERRERYHEAEAPHDAVCPTVRVLVLFTRLAVHHNRPSRSPASARAAYSAAARAGLSCAAMR